MSYKFSFADNEVYSATDVNNITKRLVTSGVADSFSDGVAYNVSKFNEAGKLLYTSGVVSEDCNTLKVTKISDTEILINPGYAFFNDGAVIEIEDGGETLSYISGSKNYVYLKNALLDENSCYPCVSVNEPTGDYVLLAEIDEKGTIVDKRTYATGKLPGYQCVAGNNVMHLKESILIKTDTKNHYISGSATFDIGNNNFEYILSMPTDGSSDCLGIYNIPKKSHIGFAYYTNSRIVYTNDSLYTYSDSHGGVSVRREISLSLENGILTVNLSAMYTTSGDSFTPGTHSFPIHLVLF